jgi:hypothetical protein
VRQTEHQGLYPTSEAQPNALKIRLSTRNFSDGRPRDSSWFLLVYYAFDLDKKRFFAAPIDEVIPEVKKKAITQNTLNESHDMVRQVKQSYIAIQK